MNLKIDRDKAIEFVLSIVIMGCILLLLQSIAYGLLIIILGGALCAGAAVLYAYVKHICRCYELRTAELEKKIMGSVRLRPEYFEPVTPPTPPIVVESLPITPVEEKKDDTGAFPGDEVEPKENREDMILRLASEIDPKTKKYYSHNKICTLVFGCKNVLNLNKINWVLDGNNLEDFGKEMG